MENRIIYGFLIIASSIVVTFEVVYDEDSSVKENHMMQLCKNLKNYTVRFIMDEFIETVSTQWKQLYLDEDGWNARNTSESWVESEDHLNEILQTCRIETETNVEVTRLNAENELEYAGIIDIRTLDNFHGNLVIKLGYRKPSCASLRQLLHCMEADSFQRMYQNEKLILLALSFNAAFDPIIYEWIAFLYQYGKIIDAQHSAKCLYMKDFSDLKYNEKPIIEYFQNANT